ncbi:hypothetical protein [Gimesia fumaroli]|uniref:hypothetical protein n=1 Tax=Gimesia fumaroli TaxID=2527976 RepID=UPI0011A2446B|nr:hypothetical protein [Gimesia fumaroli]
MTIKKEMALYSNMFNFCGCLLLPVLTLGQINSLHDFDLIADYDAGSVPVGFSSSTTELNRFKTAVFFDFKNQKTAEVEFTAADKHPSGSVSARNSIGINFVHCHAIHILIAGSHMGLPLRYDS